ncbi:MAG TPA: sulfotransferase [Solirubrobacteraceae bacterium]|nr:sulfotransferase [Solirubrobacteraceae bacterium]
MSIDEASRAGVHAEQETLEELRRARAADGRRPDFFIVGHAKCGTTALYRMLKAHPQIYMPDVKEPEFLSRAPEHRARRAEQPERPAKRLPETLEAYLALFAPATPEQLAGEASTEYLRTPAAAGRIAQLCPEARIVAMFREPVGFLRSLHLQLLQVGVETEVDFARALELETERRRGRRVPRDCPWPPALLYSDHVRYVEQLSAYHERFGRESVHVIAYEDYRRDNEGTVREVLRFLGVDDELPVIRTEANPTLRVRSRRGERLVNAVSVGKGPVSRSAKRVLKAVMPARVRRGAHRTAMRVVVESEPRPPAEELVAELRRRFAGEVVALSEYLRRDLVGLWGYEDVR